MKNKTIIYLCLIMSSFIFYTCSEDSTTEPGSTDTSNYFPVSNGNYYKYNVQGTDSAGAPVSGTRSSTYSGTMAFGGVQYQVQIDSIIFAVQPVVSNSYFRKTDTGVFYFLDTTGLSEVVPDSFLQYIQIDAELRAFASPLSDGLTWPVFKMNLSYSVFNLTVVDVTGYYVGKENVTTPALGEREAAKIRFVLTLRIPDVNNPLNQTIQTFETFAWMVADVGVVKWQGNATILNVFAGGGIDFADTSSVVTQTLTGFSLN